MSQITDWLPQFQQVNVIYSNFIECDELEYNTYRKVVDFSVLTSLPITSRRSFINFRKV